MYHSFWIHSSADGRLGCFQFSDKGPSMKWVCSPKFYSPLANWPWLRISLQSSLYVIYYLILTAWQWLMSFTCIPVQIEPNKRPLRKRLLALLLWEIGHLSSPGRLCLYRLILIPGRQGGPAGGVLRGETPTILCSNAMGSCLWQLLCLKWFKNPYILKYLPIQVYTG